MRIKLFLVLLLGLFFINSAFCFEEKSTVRVAISNKTFEHTNISFLSENIIKVIDMSQNDITIEPVEAGKIINIYCENGLFNINIDGLLVYEKLAGPLTLSSNAELQILELNKKGSPAKYKGMLELKSTKNGKFNIINIVDMENYVRGVVPNEMPISFGLEALKAQSIAARNYAVNARVNPNYDLVDTTASQVYYGANSYRSASDEAVLKTFGIYATYKDNPISALYFSTSPGITDDWDDVFNNGVKSDKYPYLKAKADFVGQKFLNSEDDVIKFYSNKNNGLDTNSPKFRWNYEISRVELENILHNTLQQQSKLGLVEPKYDGDVPIDGLKDIRALKRTKSGKITELLIESKSGDYKVKKEIGIRRVLKIKNVILPSANFYVEKTGIESLNDKTTTIHEAGIIKLFDIITDEKYPSVFKFTGGGYGHGVGMSQFGAYNMAKQGKKYPAILKHYYTDIRLSTLTKNVKYNPFNSWYKTVFYYDSSEYTSAYLIIENPKLVSNFSFKINNYEFLDTKSALGKKLVKINITQYLKNGINNIYFAPITNDNKSKELNYRVEFI